MGLFELMIMNDELRDMIMANASVDELRAAAQGQWHGRAARRRTGLLSARASRPPTKSSAKRLSKALDY